MGIFSKKSDSKPVIAKPARAGGKAAPKAKKEAVKAEAKAPKAKSDKVVVNSSKILRNPRITEKAAHVSDNRVYTFDVYEGASKIEIAKAVTSVYGVTPVRVNVSAVPKKYVLRRNRLGVKGGGRKAYVYLKKGDKIEFI